MSKPLNRIVYVVLDSETGKYYGYSNDEESALDLADNIEYETGCVCLIEDCTYDQLNEYMFYDLDMNSNPF